MNPFDSFIKTLKSKIFRYDDVNIKEASLLNAGGIYKTKMFKDIEVWELPSNDEVPSKYGKIFGVDGSNKAIIQTNEFSLMLCRIVGTDLKIKYFSEFFSLVYLNDEGTYSLEHHHIRGIKLFDNNTKIYDPYDTSYTFRGRRANPSEIGNILRKYAEWEMVNYINQVENNVVILRDGSLHSTIRDEVEIMRKALSKANTNNKILGVVKDNLLLTDTYHNLIEAATRYVTSTYKYQRWVFGSIAEGIKEIHPAKIYVVRFHPLSKPYRIDAPLNIDEEEFKGILDLILNYTLDSDFLGYPYQLVKADRESNIKPHEVNFYRNRILKDEEFWRIHEMFRDTHEMLWKV